MSIIVPIRSYVAENTSLEVNQDLRNGKTYLIVRVEDNEVVSVDYGYQDIQRARSIASEWDETVITPKQGGIV